VTEPHETSEVLAAMAAIRGRPDELAALLAIVKREGAPEPRDGSMEECRTAVRKLLRERLRHLLAEAQRDIEDVLTRADRRPGPRAGERADSDADATGDAVAGPSYRASSSGAYLATAATIRHGGATATAPQLSGARRDPEPEPDRLLETADIGTLTARIVEIQRGLSAL
jgi:hypothetical protein